MTPNKMALEIRNHFLSYVLFMAFRCSLIDFLSCTILGSKNPIISSYFSGFWNLTLATKPITIYVEGPQGLGPKIGLFLVCHFFRSPGPFKRCEQLSILHFAFLRACLHRRSLLPIVSRCVGHKTMKHQCTTRNDS